MAHAPATPTTAAPITPAMDVEPAYWRLLLRHIPRIAVDRLAREIRTGRFNADGLRARARDLRAHNRPEIRERARLELFPALGLGDDGLEPSAHFD